MIVVDVPFAFQAKLSMKGRGGTRLRTVIDSEQISFLESSPEDAPLVVAFKARSGPDEGEIRDDGTRLLEKTDFSREHAEDKLGHVTLIDDKTTRRGPAAKKFAGCLAKAILIPGGTQVWPTPANLDLDVHPRIAMPQRHFNEDALDAADPRILRILASNREETVAALRDRARRVVSIGGAVFRQIETPPVYRFSDWSENHRAPRRGDLTGAWITPMSRAFGRLQVPLSRPDIAERLLRLYCGDGRKSTIEKITYLSPDFSGPTLRDMLTREAMEALADHTPRNISQHTAAAHADVESACATGSEKDIVRTLRDWTDTHPHFVEFGNHRIWAEAWLSVADMLDRDAVPDDDRQAILDGLDAPAP